MSNPIKSIFERAQQLVTRGWRDRRRITSTSNDAPSTSTTRASRERRACPP